MELPAVAPFPLSDKEVAQLVSLVSHEGWPVFARIRAALAEHQVDTAMSLSTPMEGVQMARGAYAAHRQDVSFADDLLAALKE